LLVREIPAGEVKSPVLICPRVLVKEILSCEVRVLVMMLLIAVTLKDVGVLIVSLRIVKLFRGVELPTISLN